MEWGSNPDTVMAAATVVAAIAAITAGFYAARSFSQMRKQAEASMKQLEVVQKQAHVDRERLEADWKHRERAQADAVAGWTDEATGEDGEEKLFVVLQNASAVPVYELRVAVSFETSDGSECRYASTPKFLPPTTSKNEWIVAAPGAQSYWKDVWLKRRTKNRNPLVELVFQDSYGKTWIRSPAGVLREYENEHHFPAHWKKMDGKPLIPSS